MGGVRHTYPGTWGARYDELQAAAIKGRGLREDSQWRQGTVDARLRAAGDARRLLRATLTMMREE